MAFYATFADRSNGVFVTTVLDLSAIDCNSDGVVDVADLQCIATTEDLNALLGELHLLKGDFDGIGGVAFADFLVMSANFGQNVDSYVLGDIDLNGSVEFFDFL